jgi:RNA polymerase sigma-70 factor, ECF subfamily
MRVRRACNLFLRGPVIGCSMNLMADQWVATSQALDSASDFSGWMAAEQRRVFLLCQRMLGDSEDADSAVQDVFLKAYRALSEQGSQPDDPARWLTRIAVNTCLDRLRSRRWQFWRKRPRQEDQELILAMAPSAAPESEQLLLSKEIGARIAKALDRLSGRQRAVFTLRHYEDRSLEEIGAALGLDVGTVKAHLSRAVKKLRQELKDLYALGPREAGRSRMA